MDDLDSDSDVYIDLSDKLESNSENIYQFQINNEKLFLKFIGKSTYIPDIIIKEKFGLESNMYLYNCIYSENEIYKFKNLNEKKLFFPIIKLIIKEKQKNKMYSIVVKINQEIIFDNEINNWEIYFTQNLQSEDFIKTIKINKNINSSNIIEEIIKFSIS